MKELTKRSLIIGAGLAAAAPKLVRAESIIDIPWNMRSAQRWAEESFNEHPGCRLMFADGSSYRWFNYPHVARQNASGEWTYAIAIEVSVTDAKGRRSINTIPVDGYELSQGRATNDTKHNAKLARRWNKLWES